jgi:D-alanyl-D-alanine carboxypeptidase
MIAVVSAVAVATVSPAEAKRRIHRSGGYNPPYADMIVDAKTGKVLHAQNEDALRHPASVTKVMTLYLLFEQLEKGRYRLDSPLRVSAHAQRMAPSKLGLVAGEEIAVEDAIKALVTKSANDVAATVAENIGGSEDAFAEMMTRKARQLGMTRTVYKNASGLPDPGQVTTARDLVTLGRAIQERFPKYYPYFSLAGFSYDGAYHRNHNHLLGRIEGMDGIKTGYTRMSGFNLLTSVKTEGRHIVGVVLGGRTAGARDARMAQLIEDNVERAYAGARTAPAVAEVAERTESPRLRSVASADDETPTTTAAVTLMKAAKPAGETPVARAAVATAVGTSTATPASGMRWSTGPQPVAAKAEPAKAEIRVAKLEPKAEPKAETKLAKTEARPAVSGWIIQLGATDDEAKAKEILQRAKSQGRGKLANASGFTEKVSKGGSTLYRARFSGFDEEDAQSACKALKRSGFQCFATRA